MVSRAFPPLISHAERASYGLGRRWVQRTPVGRAATRQQSSISASRAAPSDSPASETDMPPPPDPLSFRQKYGQPITAFIQWTSLTFVTLEFFYLAMETEDVKERTEAELAGLRTRLEEAKLVAAAREAESGGHSPAARTRTWWEWLFGSTTSQNAEHSGRS